MGNFHRPLCLLQRWQSEGEVEAVIWAEGVTGELGSGTTGQCGWRVLDTAQVHRERRDDRRPLGPEPHSRGLLGAEGLVGRYPES